VAGIGGTGREVFAPQLGEPGLKEPVDHRRNPLAHRLWGNKAAPDVEEGSLREPRIAHGDALQPRPSPESIQRAQEPRLAGRPVAVFPGRRTAPEARKINAPVRFFENLQATRHRPALGALHLEGEQIGRGRLGRQRGERDPALSFRENLDGGVTREGTIQGSAFLTPLLLDLRDTVRSPGGERERRIIGGALDLKVLGAILIRVPLAIGPDHPDFFAAELVTQGLEHAHFIGEAVDPWAPRGIGLQHCLAPVVPDHPLPGHVLLHGLRADTTGEGRLEERERPEERLRSGVGRAKFPGGQERGQHRAIVGAGRATHDRLDVRAIEGTCGFPLFREIAERRLTDDRTDHLVDHAGGVVEARLRHAIEHPGCPMHQ